MLQYNNASARHRFGMHLAHVCASGIHLLCCGLPLAAQLAGLGLLTAAGLGAAHLWLHVHEWWVLGFSASVFLLGVGLEWRDRWSKGKRGPSWLLSLTAVCLIFNGIFIGTHQASATQQAAAIEQAVFARP